MSEKIVKFADLTIVFRSAFSRVVQGEGGSGEYFICVFCLRRFGWSFDPDLKIVEIARQLWRADCELRTGSDFAKRTEYLFAESLLSFDGGVEL